MKKSLTLVALSTFFVSLTSGCNSTVEQDFSDTPTVIVESYKHLNGDSTEIAQLMCVKRHLARYQEEPRSIPSGQHKIFVRAVDHMYMIDSLRRQKEWGGKNMGGSYVMLEANLQENQHVMIRRQDENDMIIMWLEDLKTGKPASDVKGVKRMSKFDIANDKYEGECAKSTI